MRKKNRLNFIWLMLLFVFSAGIYFAPSLAPGIRTTAAAEERPTVEGPEVLIEDEAPPPEEVREEGVVHSVLVFFRRYGPDTLHATREHIYLVLLALIIAVFIAVPLGIYLTRCPWAALVGAVMGVVGVIQTIPALALIAFIVILFALFRLPAIGLPPALLALVLYALLPILRNTYTSIMQVDPAIKEVARGMGMRPLQVLWKVELPLALPVIMAGIRIATVWTIGIATLCALVGAGGLGRLIFQGLQSITMPLMIAGTVPAAMMALFSDWLLSQVENWLTPAGIWK